MTFQDRRRARRPAGGTVVVHPPPLISVYVPPLDAGTAFGDAYAARQQVFGAIDFWRFRMAVPP
jgi:hypothetical protein